MCVRKKIVRVGPLGRHRPQPDFTDTDLPLATSSEMKKRAIVHDPFLIAAAHVVLTVAAPWPVVPPGAEYSVIEIAQGDKRELLNDVTS